jgi:hypothetical protein
MLKNLLKLWTLGALLALAGCGEEDAATSTSDGLLAVDEGDITKVDPGKADSSAQAVFVDMELDGEVLADFSFDPEQTIQDQFLYTIGHLNGDNAVGRLDKLVLTNLKSESVGGKTKLSYHAKIQVAWGKRNNVPAKYEFILPRDISFSSQEKFAQKYGHDCVDVGAHDVDAGSIWYYYRPKRSSCKLASEDVFRATANVALSPVNTTGKYPEYDKVWEDGVFEIVAIFGKYEDGATTEADAGIAAYNRFSQVLRDDLRAFNLTTTPSTLSRSPGVATPEFTLDAKLDDTHTVRVHALMVDNVREAGPTFDARYAELSTKADFIVYNGHAGLGANIRALARKGRWQQGQYVMVFMNGCDTYAYVDSALFDAHAAVNPDDPKGSKYTDIITNAQPAFFVSMPQATRALIKGLFLYNAPKTYEQIFKDIDSNQIVLVSGEEDNTFNPSAAGGGAQPVNTWAGQTVEGSVTKAEEKRFETPVLPAGTYTFTMTGTGDADLHIRVGEAPTTATFDCRPFKGNSNEVCQVELSAPSVIHGMVAGWARSSTFKMVGAKK